MSAGLRFNVKDQSGVAASTEWLRDRGAGTYGPRSRGRGVEDRTTRPIDWARFEYLMDHRRCPCCPGILAIRANPAGGQFLGCDLCEYYAGWRADEGRGEERIV